MPKSGLFSALPDSAAIRGLPEELPIFKAHTRMPYKRDAGGQAEVEGPKDDGARQYIGPQLTSPLAPVQCAQAPRRLESWDFLVSLVELSRCCLLLSYPSGVTTQRSKYVIFDVLLYKNLPYTQE